MKTSEKLSLGFIIVLIIFAFVWTVVLRKTAPKNVDPVNKTVQETARVYPCTGGKCA